MKNAKSFNNIPNLIKDLPNICDVATEAAGVYFAGEIVKKIGAQDPKWQPKAESTLRSEGKGKTQLWVNSGDLRAEIHQEEKKPLKTRQRNTFAVQVGVFSKSRSLAAHYLEYGSPGGKIVARPLFAPTFDTHIRKMRRVYINMLKKGISKHLRELRE